ncbi:MAG: DUF6197 family protein [Mycobacterium sp.]
MTENRKASAVLRDALQYIKTNGWAKEEYGYRKPGDTCPSCALGAVAAAEQLDLRHIDTDPSGFIVKASKGATNALARALPKHIRTDLRVPEDIGNNITCHNDVADIDEPGVCAWFDRAIEIAEKAEAKAGAR